MENLTTYSVKLVYNDDMLAESHGIRKAVFIDEQGVPEALELDDHDADSMAVVVYNSDNMPVATARVRPTREGNKLERFAVLKAYRQLGIGKFMMQSILQLLTLGDKPFYLHAQIQVKSYYKALGFEAKSSQTFTEAGIEHVKMYYIKPLV